MSLTSSPGDAQPTGRFLSDSAVVQLEEEWSQYWEGAKAMGIGSPIAGTGLVP